MRLKFLIISWTIYNYFNLSSNFRHVDLSQRSYLIWQADSVPDKNCWLHDAVIKLHRWWLLRVTLVVTFGFLPQNFEDLWIIFLLNNKCNLSGIDNLRWWGHSNTTSWEKIWTLCTLRRWECKKLYRYLFLVLVLAPHVSHLVKLSIPNIYRLQKGNVLHLSGSHSVHGGGVCHTHTPATPLWEYTPKQTPPGRHPQADTPLADIPQADTLPGQTPPWADTIAQTKVTYYKSMVKSVHKGRWLPLLVKTKNCKLLMRCHDMSLIAKSQWIVNASDDFAWQSVQRLKVH